MTNEDPRFTLLQRLDFSDLDSCAELFTEDFVWHYRGNYRGNYRAPPK